MKKVIIHPIESVADELLNALTNAISQNFQLPVQLGAEFSFPAYTFLKSRGQYHGNALLKALNQVFKNSNHLHLAITEKDLFEPGLQFIFAATLAPSAVISTARLNPRFYGIEAVPHLLAMRTIKIALHELGQLLGLDPCYRPQCVMHFTSSLEETDRKKEQFCSKHLLQLGHVFEQVA